MDNIIELKYDEYFKKGEKIYIHLSDKNSDLFNGVLHNHNFIELIYVISGKAIHQIDNQSYEVKKGHVVMIDYGVPHSFSYSSDTDDDFVTFDLLFTPDLFNQYALESEEFYSLTSPYFLSPLFSELNVSKNSPRGIFKTDSVNFYNMFKEIYDEYTNREVGFQNMMGAYLIKLIIEIFREINKTHTNFTKTHHDLVQSAIDYMQENYRTHISLDDIVKGMFLSKNYFRQIFKKTTGISISEFIKDLRIKEACKLLEETEKSSAEISVQCGFNDSKFFYLTFKKSLGMTPIEYRKHIRKEKNK